MHLLDCPEIPPHEVDGMGEAEIGPVSVLYGPRALLVIPVHAVVVVRVDNFDLSNVPCFELLSLALKGLVEASGLADLQPPALFSCRLQEALGLRRIVDKRLCADYVLACS